MVIHKRNKYSIKVCEPAFIIPPLGFVDWKDRTSWFWENVTCKLCMEKKATADNTDFKTKLKHS